MLGLILSQYLLVHRSASHVSEMKASELLFLSVMMISAIVVIPAVCLSRELKLQLYVPHLSRHSNHME